MLADYNWGLLHQVVVEGTWSFLLIHTLCSVQQGGINFFFPIAGVF